MKIANKSFVLDLEITQPGICFEGDVEIDKTAGKTVGDMKRLLRSRNLDEDEKLYDFYVGVGLKGEKEGLIQSGLRYDIILISPGTVGGEYKKTSGHVHEGLYPEIYEVLYGTALFILQKGTGKDVSYFAAVKTRAGEKILVPPGYTHATVNIGDGPLLFSDLVADECQNHYEDVQANCGMSYYVLDQKGEPVFEKNPNYGCVPAERIIGPVKKPELGLEFDVPVYDLVSESPKRYDYLVHPERYMASINYLAEVIEERKH